MHRYFFHYYSDYSVQLIIAFWYWSSINCMDGDESPTRCSRPNWGPAQAGTKVHFSPEMGFQPHCIASFWLKCFAAGQGCIAPLQEADAYQEHRETFLAAPVGFCTGHCKPAGHWQKLLLSEFLAWITIRPGMQRGGAQPHHRLLALWCCSLK